MIKDSWSFLLQLSFIVENVLILLQQAELNGRFRFFYCPALWVISQPDCAAKSAASPVRLMPCRATRAPQLFLLSSSSSQPLESLQPYQQWQRTPLPVRLPALVGGPQDAGQLTVATGSRVLRLASTDGCFRFSCMKAFI